MQTAGRLFENSEKRTGLVLSGGGARAAYQVGVLKAIAAFLPRKSPNPFDIICGTSAGAINAAVIATRAVHFRSGILNMEQVWRNFSADRIYRSDILGILGSTYRWAGSLFGLGGKDDAIALFDNTPLRRLLSNVIPFEKIQLALDEGHLQAVSVTASSYSSGESITFFQALKEFDGWSRVRRVGKPAVLMLDHLIASSAIPVFFPAVKIDGHYYGDGAVRQLAPISPALHLGAGRIMIIGVSGNAAFKTEVAEDMCHPSLAQIAGHLLNSAFLDSFDGDIERMERINKTISLIPVEKLDENQIHLRKVGVLVISPSQPLDAIAAKHIKDLSRTMRFLMGRAGATESRGASILSYLLFEKGFCRELIQLGYTDALSQKQEIVDFFQGTRVYSNASVKHG